MTPYDRYRKPGHDEEYFASWLMTLTVASFGILVAYCVAWCIARPFGADPWHVLLVLAMLVLVMRNDGDGGAGPT